MKQLEAGVYLEIGVGANDFEAAPTMLFDASQKRGPRRFVNGAQYVGIDLPRDHKRYWLDTHAWMTGSDMADHDWDGTTAQVNNQLRDAERMIRRKCPGEAISFMAADAHALPFSDASIREIYLANVLSSQLAISSIERIVAESRRVLQANGRLVARETFTPHWFTPEDFAGVARDSGFDGPHISHGNTPAYRTLAHDFGFTQDDIFPAYHSARESYFAVTQPLAA
jgi:hypothetical protein